MNTDDFLTDALQPLRAPLPPEHSLMPGVLARLVQPANVELAQMPASRPPRRGLLKWIGPAGIAAVAILTIGLLSPFKSGSPMTMAQVMAAVVREHWVHLVYQDGSETWVCLDDGKFLMKRVHDAQRTTYFMKDPATRTEQYLGELNEIQLRQPEAWVLGVNRNGKTIPIEVNELTFCDEDLAQSRKVSEAERKQLRAIRDFDIVVEGDRKLGHFTDLTRDALGELQVTRELWVDLTTKLPVRARSWEFAGNTATRVQRDGTFHFVKNGPEDLYSLGVPRTVPIVPQVRNAQSARQLIPAATWKAIDGAREAVKRFPHRFRILTLGDISIVYVDSGDAHPFEWVDDQTPRETVTRYFFADCQDSGAASPMFALLIQIFENKQDLPIPADAIAGSFPFKSSVNMQLIDGKRWFVLTRSSSNPPTSRLQVLPASGPDGVRELENQWQYAEWNWTELATGQSTETAPAGQILVHAERSDMKNDWFVDPDRDYTVARHIEHRRAGEKWIKIDTKAVQWERLPDGPWYVSGWETRQNFIVTSTTPDGKETQHEEESVDYQRVVITPLNPEDFPADIFDGDKFLEAARAEGAEIRAQ